MSEMNGAYGPMRRKEDARFIRGMGTFVDDIALPGMLHGAVLRSPLAHARILSVDTTAAEAEGFLLGAAATEENFARAGQLAAEHCRPVSDQRGPAAYKRHLAAELTVRALRRAADRARHEGA